MSGFRTSCRLPAIRSYFSFGVRSVVVVVDAILTVDVFACSCFMA